MNAQIRSAKSLLGTYLNAAVGISGLAATADAAIVQLDVTTISGTNAGLSIVQGTSVSLSTLGSELTGGLRIRNQYFGNTGLAGDSGASIAVQGAANASPTNFAGNALIDADATFTENKYQAIFKVGSTVSPDFGSGSYMGFKSANGHYGWLEVTWDSASGNFEILSGAFEDVAGVGIRAGAVSAVPEPAGVLGTLGLLSAGTFLRRRKLAD